MTYSVGEENIQDDSGGRVSILGIDSIGRCENEVYMNACLILIGYRDRAF